MADGTVSWLPTFLAVVVTAVWVAAFVADIIVESYAVPWAIHALMLGVVGSIFGFQVAGITLRRNGK